MFHSNPAFLNLPNSRTNVYFYLKLTGIKIILL